MASSHAGPLSQAKPDELKLVGSICSQIAALGMSFDEVKLFIQTRVPTGEDPGKEAVEHALRQVVEEHRVPDDAKAFRAVVRQLQKFLRLDSPPRLFEPQWKRLLGWSKSVALAFLFAFCLYMVVGGIVTGQSVLLGTLPAWVSVPILALLLLTLAVVEGLEVSVLSLQLRRLDSVRVRYPRAYETHEKLLSYENVDRFLSGRQAFVIFLVFLIAALTSFPGMTAWPFIGVEFPQWMGPWFETVFLRLGLLGALLAVWLGQLGPKLIANRNPLDFLNLPGMGLICRLAMATESVGLTLPSAWAARLFFVGRTRRDFPYSHEEEYRTKSAEYGYQVTRRYVSLEFGKYGLELHKKETARILAPTAEVTQSGFLSGPATKSSGAKGYLLKPDGGPGAPPSTRIAVWPATGTDASSGVSFRTTAKPLRGEFMPGEIVSIASEIAGGALDQHQGYIGETMAPTLMLEFRVKLGHVRSNGVRVFVTTPGGQRTEREVSVSEEVEGDVMHYVEWYPVIGSVHEITWDHSH